MLYNAFSGTLMIDDIPMEYITFGKGDKNLVMIQGLGDGLRTVRGLALPMAFLYRLFADKYKVYVFSRKNIMPSGYTTKDMSDDLKKAMDILHIDKADIVGVSQGGMIAQHFAADYPDTVNKLALVVTCGKANDCLVNCVSPWKEMAKQGRYKDLMADNFRKMYTEEYIRRNRLMLPFATRIGAPESYDRFLVMADACINHNAMDKLPLIRSETLIIGGEKDKVADGKASLELHKYIKNSELFIYSKYGHSLYDEAKDFNSRLLDFFMRK